MADITVQRISAEDGAVLTLPAASAGGDKFVWEEKASLMVVNGGGVSVTVTVTAATAEVSGEQGDLTRSNLVMVLAAGQTGIIPPMPTAFRNRADLDKVAVTYSGVASVKVQPFIAE